jgi:peptidase E
MASRFDLVLTSDFPSTANEAVVELIASRFGRDPRIAWIPPVTTIGRSRFAAARERWSALGFARLEYCDIDEQPDTDQLAHLASFDVVYLTGGDPIVFRRNLARTGVAVRLGDCLQAGCVVIGASGGAMQLTANVSLFRLGSESLDDVLSERDWYDGAGAVAYEILPHLNRHEPEFVERVREYADRSRQTVLALADGAAILHSMRDDWRSIGHVARILPRARGLQESVA